MLLGRLRIRGKLTLLVLIPLIATIALTAANAVELVGKASRAQQTAAAVRVARVTGELIREVQLERLLTVGLLRHNVDRAQLSLQKATVAEKASNLRHLGAELSAPLATAVGNLKSLDGLRASALDGSATVFSIFAGYNTAITGLIDATRLLEAVDGSTPQGHQVIGLDSIMRVNEGFAAMLAGMAAVSSPAELAPFTQVAALMLPSATRFLMYATIDQRGLFTNCITAVDARLGQGATVAMVTNPSSVLQLKSLPSFAAAYSLTGVGRFVETKIINDTLAATDSSATREAIQASGFGAASLVIVLIVVLMGVAVGRSVAGPLRRLTQSADRVARLAESELVRVADDDAQTVEPARLRPVDASGSDELSDLARAFGRVQETAARLVERQVASRRNVAQMFGHVGRRTQNLVGRQIALIDKLENNETEPGRLRDLYRLDHVSSRLRRSASSLVVLSGESGADEHVAPVALVDVVRLALGEIEDYSRVDVDLSTSVRVVPALINDLVLLLAELMENATGFSPPTTRVTVSAVPLGEGVRLTIVDHGLGMPAQRMVEENGRLTRRERLDLAPTEVLGLFVVGRLARRHGLAVELVPTDGGGVTVNVDVAAHLLTAFGPIAAPALAASSARSAAARRTHTGAHDAVTASPMAERDTAASRTMLVLANVDPAVFNVGAIDRATSTLHTVEPWNAFQAARPDVRSDDTAANAAPDTSPVDRAVPESPALEWPPPQWPLSQPPIQLPCQRVPQSAPHSVSHATAPSSPSTPRPAPSRRANLRRRVPGATLDSLESRGRTSRTAPVDGPQWDATQSADANQVRDSLADFESGVARALREVRRERDRLLEASINEDRRDDEEGSG